VIGRPLGRRRRGRGASAEPPEPRELDVDAVLLASEGRPIPVAAADLAAGIGRRSGAPVHVFSVARIWGTSFGFPNPGLMPTRREWDEQRRVVDSAISRLERRGVEARGRVLSTRSAAKRIVQEAQRLGCGAIVMGADPEKGALRGDFDWAQEPYRVRRRTDIPVYLVVEDRPAHSRRPANV
jgi:nucleotide-binding universal stress UspA family protein